MRWLGIVVVVVLNPSWVWADERLAFFEKKIRPVLVEQCYSCHSAEAQAKKKLRGGLRLDTREGLLMGGDSGPAVVPGKPDESLLLRSLRHDGDVKMPPKGKLSDAILADFATWIAKGAVDPRSGSVSRQQGLSLEQGRAFWAYQPLRPAPGSIDDQLSRKWRANGLQPTPQADRPTLIRRLSFDLLGLPPSPEEIDAFVGDDRPDAYERLVDRLLASPHFGERWGRHWLDLARYADSLTLRGFVLKQAWRYRDYVIDCFNADVPYDRFVREQIAGDLLPADSAEARRRQLIATTFLTLGNTNLEEQDKSQLRMDVVDEQLDTIGRAILAQTIGCARCHDHKFDPIPTRDYYALAGILRNTRTLTHANVSMWLELPLPAEPAVEQRLREHEAAIATLQRQITALKSRQKSTPQARAITELPGIVVDDTQARKVGTWIDSKHTAPFVGAGYVHDGNTDKGEKTITFQPKIETTGKYEVLLSYSPGTNRAARVPVTIFSADGEKTIHLDMRKPPSKQGLFVSLGEFTFEKSGQGFVLIANEGTTGHVIADAVVFLPSGTTLPTKKIDELAELEAKLKRLQASGPRREMVMSVQEEKQIEDARIHIRGNVHKQGELVPRGVLQVALRGEAPRMPAQQSGRRELADWLASPANPLTARVFANRVWYWLLGEGLVRTVDNFGTTGEKPDHPELLDTLAAKFIEDGWSIKALVRRIVLSHTYRRASGRQPRDPENRLWSHTNRRRLDAESIRDTILTVSGQLRLDRGGPTYPATLASDYHYQHHDMRRSVYAPVFRNALPELFEVFDFADPSVSTGRRNHSTVAPQALFLMNHPLVLQQAEQAARRLLARDDLDDGARLDWLYRQALGRLPTPGERSMVQAYLDQAKERTAGWAQVVQVVFASLDFRYLH